MCGEAWALPGENRGQIRIKREEIQRYPYDDIYVESRGDPSSEDVGVLSQGLTAHALPYTQGPGFHPLGVFLRDESCRER